MSRGVNRIIKGEYPDDWPEISQKIKEAAEYRCERCGHESDIEAGDILTTHHLDGDKSNCEDWNLAALCQRCHLSIQARVNPFQDYMFSHSAWMKPHVEGRNQAMAAGTWP